MRRIPQLAIAIVTFAVLAAGCGDDSDASTAAGPTVVVTTNILGDVVTNITGGAVEVITVMSVGADPHDFQASARQADDMRSASVLIINGGGFEEGLDDVIDGAESDGVVVYEALDAVAQIEFGEAGHDDEHEDHDAEHDDHDGDHEDHDAEHDDHEHEGVDPHFFTDPARMAVAAQAISTFLIDNVDGIDAATVRTATADYVAELEALDAEVAELTATIPAEQRVLVTNHAVFGYFAERYDFEVIGAVIPTGSTTDGVSAGQLAELAEILEHEGVRAVFADTSSSDELVETLAAEVGDVLVESLYSESLGPADSDAATYVAMVRTNAERIAAALGG